MADDSGGPTIPSTDNWSEWTFEQALKAITGEGSDLHAPAKATWFNVSPNPSGPADSSYHAWDKYYFSVSINADAVNAWVAAVDAITEMMPDVARGKRGSMDQQTLVRLAGAIDDFAGWSRAVGLGMDQWANRLDSDDSAFKGKAAFLIYWRLKVQGDGLDDTYEQLTSRHGKPIFASVADAANELANFNAKMASTWDIALKLNIRNWISNAILVVIDDVTNHVRGEGLVANTPNYKLNGKKRGDAENEIRMSLAKYHKGDLTSASTWKSLGDGVTAFALDMLKQWADSPAQTAIGALAPKYVLATSSLIEITAPPPQTAPQPDTDPPDGGGDDKKNLPPPPDGGGDGNNKINLPPPPDGGGDGNNKTNLPPPPDGGMGGDNKTDLPPPPDGGMGGGGSDGLNLPNGGGGSEGLDLPGGGSDGLNLPGGGADGLNPPGGGGGPNGQNLLDGGGDPANGSAGGFLPGLVPPGGGADGNGSSSGKNGTGPGADGAFDENGLGNDLLKPPDGGGDGFSTLPSGSGSSGTQLPPGGGSDGRVDLSTPPKRGSDADGGLGIGPGGFGSDPGKGFGSGLGLGGPNGEANLLGGLGGPGGLGGGLGGPGNSGLTGLPSQLSGGSPGVNGAPGSTGDGNGVPFFPPMMGGGGAGGAGEKPEERERQTWLSEDEEIWGTRVSVRSRAIGRLDEDDDVEEFPLVGPTRGQRRADTPRRPRPDEKRDATSSEEASGSA